MSSLQNQTNVIPKVLYGESEVSGSEVSMNISATGIILGGDLNTANPITATISQAGIITDNPTGFNILSSLNMNLNDINNVNSLNGVAGGVDISINSSNQITMTSSDNININPSVNFVVNASDSAVLNGNGGSANAVQLNAPSSNILATTQLINMIDGVNNDYINLDMRTGLDQIPTIEMMKDNLIATISKNNDLYITTDQGLQQTADKAIQITTNNDNINLNTSNGKTYINKNGTGDGEIVASNFVGNLSGNANTASLATQITTTNTTANATHYLDFSDSSATGNGSVQKTAGLSCNPSTNTITATSFVGDLTGSCSTNGLVYLYTRSIAITGSSSATNLGFSTLFNSTYKNYRIVLSPTTQLSFASYPSYALQAFLGSGTLPTTASLFGNELTSNSPASLAVVYTNGATIATTPLVFAVSQAVNHQTIIEIENVGFANTQTQQVGLKCKSFYSNPGVSGYSDRSILCSSVSGATITGLIIQQGALSVGNNMTLQAVIYGYK